MLVPTLMTLLLILSTGSSEAQDTSDPLITIRASTVRRATARIDSLELRLMLEHNRTVERDSMHAGEVRYMKWAIDEANDRASLWHAEATSWWNRHESAFWIGVGGVIFALATGHL